MSILAIYPIYPGAVPQDYAARWPELTPPPLAECEAFLAVLVVE